MTFDDKDLPRFVTKKQTEFYDQSENITKKGYKKAELKYQC